MENRENQNYGQENRDFNQDLDTLIDKENANKDNRYKVQEEFIDDVNHQTNDYNRNENNPGEEPIVNDEEQITNDEDPEDLDDSLEKDGDLDDDDSEEEKEEEISRNLERDIDEVSHDPFPSISPEKF
ncbi:hypothetical protein ACHRV6_08125 [Flavobacterium sp. FlaQc-51]|uniref:hypothetical protein n=1 Tax=Flavobacterium sp. FlaQc-51 TaxID=3374184 RepID=UPI003756B335